MSSTTSSCITLRTSTRLCEMYVPSAAACIPRQHTFAVLMGARTANLPTSRSRRHSTLLNELSIRICAIPSRLYSWHWCTLAKSRTARRWRSSTLLCAIIRAMSCTWHASSLLRELATQQISVLTLGRPQFVAAQGQDPTGAQAQRSSHHVVVQGIRGVEEGAQERADLASPRGHDVAVARL